MKVLIDANIIVTFLTRRNDPFRLIEAKPWNMTTLKESDLEEVAHHNC